MIKVNGWEYEHTVMGSEIAALFPMPPKTRKKSTNPRKPSIKIGDEAIVGSSTKVRVVAKREDGNYDLEVLEGDHKGKIIWAARKYIYLTK